MKALRTWQLGHAVLEPQELSDSGRYCLIIKLNHRVWLRVGSLGNLEFCPGLYVYTGSAAKGLTARVSRHLKKRKRKHWHIDHLLASRSARVVASILVMDMRLSECELNQLVMNLADGKVPGFGSTDCQNDCGSHLAYFNSEPKTALRGARAR